MEKAIYSDIQEMKMKYLNRTNEPTECEKDMRKSSMTASPYTKLALTGLLVFGVGFSVSGMVSPVMAAPPACDSGEVSKRCKNDGGGLLVAKFCLDITDETPGLAGDGSTSDGGWYCHKNKKDKILVFTGNGPGFRFDTNKGKSTAVRNVQINFPGGWITVNDADESPHTYYSGLYEIDFRFDLDSGGLDLAALTVGGDSGDVPIGIRILEVNGSELGLLGYGNAPDLFSDPSLVTTCMVSYTKNAVVTRTAADTWTIESDPDDSDACLWVGHSNFAGQSGMPVEMPFDFTIVID